MKNKDLALFAKYTSLNVIGMIGMSVYILADTFFIANGVGANGLTALNLALPIFNIVNGTGLMLAMGGATKYNVCKSRGDSHGMDSAFVNTMYAAAFFSAVYMLCGALFSTQIASTLGANSEVLESTAIYLKVIMLFSPGFIFNNIAIAFVRNDGAPSAATLPITLKLGAMRRKWKPFLPFILWEDKISMLMHGEKPVASTAPKIPSARG